MSYNDNNLVLIVSASSDVESAKYECPRLMDSINRTWWTLAVLKNVSYHEYISNKKWHFIHQFSPMKPNVLYSVTVFYFQYIFDVEI